MIDFSCPHCGKGLKLSAKAAGRKGKCKHCRRSITVPLSSETGNRSETGDCPSCGMELEISPNATGTLVKCPDCNDLLRTTASGFERQPDVGPKSTKPEITVKEDELPEVIFEDELPEVSGQHRIHVAPIAEVETVSADLPSANLASKEPIRVKVVDFDMHFDSMIVFMIKWAFASIPAGIVLFLIYALIMMVFGKILGVGN